MALINCSECRRKISDKAISCPHCGCPLSVSAQPKSSAPSAQVRTHTMIYAQSIQPKKIKPWLILTSSIILFVIIVTIAVAVILSLPSKYTWDDVILKTVLPEPSSNYGYWDTNEADRLDLTVTQVSFSDFENYVTNCVDYGFTYVVESSASSYTAFNRDGCELELDYHENEEELNIDIHLRVSGTIKWPTTELVAQIPIPNSSVGSVVYSGPDSYVVYIGNTTKDEFITYISNCESKGYNINIRKQNNSFYAENNLGHELFVEYYSCNLIYINISG